MRSAGRSWTNDAADIVREYDQVNWVNLAVLEDGSNSDHDLDQALMAVRTAYDVQIVEDDVQVAGHGSSTTDRVVFIGDESSEPVMKHGEHKGQFL